MSQAMFRMRLTNFTILATSAACLGALMTGCTMGGLSAETLVKHPDTPMLVSRAKGTVEVMVYDRASNEMVIFGEIDASDLEGWTLTKYDWGRVTGGTVISRDDDD